MSNNNLRANNWNCTSDEAFNAITVLQTVPFATQAYLHFVVNLRVALKPIPLQGDCANSYARTPNFVTFICYKCDVLLQGKVGLHHITLFIISPL